MGTYPWWDDHRTLDRMKEELELWQEGLSQKEIGERLDVDQSTVSRDLSKLKELGVRTSAELAVAPYLDLLLGQRGTKERKEVDAAIDALVNDPDPAAKYIADFFRLRSRRLPGGSE